jgi:hypothetical protein
MPWRLSNREKYNLNNKLMLTQDIIITSITVRAAPSYPPYAYPYDAWFMHSPLKIPLKAGNLTQSSYIEQELVRTMVQILLSRTNVS